MLSKPETIYLYYFKIHQSPAILMVDLPTCQKKEGYDQKRYSTTDGVINPVHYVWKVVTYLVLSGERSCLRYVTFCS
jgi:hypothetical protein